jgi:hypothetical protein
MEEKLGEVPKEYMVEAKKINWLALISEPAQGWVQIAWSL